MYVPSPLAALVYVGIKAIGYAAAAGLLNVRFDQDASPLAVSATKIALGFCAGMAALFLSLLLFGDHAPVAAVLAVALPFRLAAWDVLLRRFYSLERGTRLATAAAGTGWSYALDLAMAGVYRFVPGMVIPWC